MEEVRTVVWTRATTRAQEMCAFVSGVEVALTLGAASIVERGTRRI